MNCLKLKDSGLIIATRNVGKLAEFRHFLSDLDLNLCLLPDGFEVEESGTSFSENARLKSIAAARCTGQWALADDSGLSVNSLGGAPGVFSARYAIDDHGRINRILKELEGVKDRRAFFSAALCISSPQGIVFGVEGHCEGLITCVPRGKGGFGYDPIFEVSGTGLTFAEMSVEMKRDLGHRGHAFALMRPRLEEILCERKN